MRKIDEGDSEIAEMLVQAPDGYSTPLARLFTFYLSGLLLSADRYIGWFQTIRNATENDVVRIHINSRGGDASTAIQFMRVLMDSDATIIASVEGDCMSAATMIFLSADRVEISPHSLFMFHNYSGGVMGKGGEMFEQITHLQKWSEALMRDVYKDFLTDAEITSILANKDIWMDAEDAGKRVDKKIKALQKLAKSIKKDFE